MMRDPRELSERFDLRYVQRRNWPNNWLRCFNWALVALALGGLTLIMFARDDRVYTPGELSQGHAYFETDCRSCHTAGDDRDAFRLPVTDAACLACHTAEAHPDTHHIETVSGMSLAPAQAPAGHTANNCATCHVEHRGRDFKLADAPDRFCVHCHGSLETQTTTADAGALPWHDPTGRSPSLPRVAPAIASGLDDSIHSFDDDHPEWKLLQQQRKDLTPLSFGHEKHLDPDFKSMQRLIQDWVAELEASGLPRWRIPVETIAGPDGTRDNPTYRLTCAACHTADNAGRYMKPIVFQQHCAQCHSMGKWPAVASGVSIPHGADISGFAAGALSKVRSDAVTAYLKGKPDEPAADALKAFYGDEITTTPPPPEPDATAQTSRKTKRRGRGKPSKPRTLQLADTPALLKHIDSQNGKLLAHLDLTCSRCHQPVDVVNELRAVSRIQGELANIDDTTSNPDRLRSDRRALLKPLIRRLRDQGPGIYEQAATGPDAKQFAAVAEWLALSGQDLTSNEERTWEAIESSKPVRKLLDTLGSENHTRYRYDQYDWARVDPDIPDRWLPLAWFSHAAHAPINCLECHAAAEGAKAPPLEPLTGAPDPARWTGTTKNIMLPGIEDCRSCHSDAGRVRHNCATCHAYHDRSINR